MSGRKVELDKVVVPSLELVSSSSQKTVPVMPAPINEEANDDIMKLQIELLPNLVGQPEYVPCESGTVILFWKSCY